MPLLMSSFFWPALLLATLSELASPKPTAAFSDSFSLPGLLGSRFGSIGINASYDYVVVGGGTAGLAIAHRLAEHNSVAVVEAGGFYELDNSNLTQIPAYASYYLGKDPTFRNPLLDWQQMTTPQPSLDGASVLFPSGHTLGGGSTRNFMWYQRGSRGSYQRWADAVGDASYEFDSFLPHFKRSVAFSPPSSTRTRNSTPAYDESAFDPTGGPLQVGYPQTASPAASWIAKGVQALGLDQLPGMSSGSLLGWTWIANSIDPSQERSTSTSFLRASLVNAPEFDVYKNTLAKRVLFDSDKKASGVLVQSIGVGSGAISWVLNATKEVVVSAGAFRSPQLLMVSGVGPASTLDAHGIRAITDRKGVGQNMWDHVFFGPSHVVDTPTHNWLADPAYGAAATAEYAASRSGLLTNVGGDILAFQQLPTDLISSATRTDLDQAFGYDWPDIEILSLDAYTGSLNDFLLGAPRVDNFTSVCIATVAPFSRGNVSIVSDDTRDHPLIDPNWLVDKRDQEVAVAGFKQARAVFAAQEVQPILIGPEAFPGANVTTDEQILNVIKGSFSTIHHAAGTCKMGRLDDPLAVVDANGSVIGVQGLRVVDASAFPLLPPGHPQATVYALAEKIASVMLGER